MPRLSVQLYTLRSIEDEDAMLDAVAAAGYDHVELYGAKLARADVLAPRLQARGLQATGSHVGLAELDGDLDAVVAQAHAFGLTSLFVPSVPVERRSMDAAGWRALGVELARLAEALDRHGLTLGYHNHDWDLQKKDDDLTALDLVFAGAGSAPVQWEADIAWLARGGADPEVWLQRHAVRLTAAHVKDLALAGTNEAEAGWADVGAGTLDWRRLWPVAIAAGAQVLVVEHDKPLDPARTIANSFRYLKDTVL